MSSLVCKVFIAFLVGFLDGCSRWVARPFFIRFHGSIISMSKHENIDLSIDFNCGGA